MNIETTVQRLLSEEMGLHATLLTLQKLHGDASYRAYYRALLDDGSSLIVMQMPEGKASVSEEITNFNGTHRELPFINVARYLSSLGIPTPKIHVYSDDDHIMILEDLGDGLMARELSGAGQQKRMDLYAKAIDLLLDIQRLTKAGSPSDCIAFARSFDASLLHWEFQHFLEFGIEARRGAPMDAADMAIFEEITRDIVSRIEKIPYGFTHRDFQSRNLLLRDGNLAVIDFQDALLGPSVYDLVALTRDSYIELPDDMVDQLIERFASGTERETCDVRREYDLVTVQRKLKDAGRFVFIDQVKKNPGFLKFIPASLGYAQQALQRLPEYEPLLRTLTKYVPEWN
jgi:hypothetical protein